MKQLLAFALLFLITSNTVLSQSGWFWQGPTPFGNGVFWLNPFNPTTSIRYSLKQDSWVTVIIYNILGQEVRRLIDRYEDAGFKSIAWDGTNNNGSEVSTGIYFLKLSAGQFIDQKKMVIIR